MNFDLAVVLDALIDPLHRKEHFVHRQDGAVAVYLPVGVSCLQILPECFGGGFGVADAAADGGGGQVVEQGVEAFEEQGEVVFQAGGAEAVAHILIQRALPRVHIKTLVEAGSEAGDGGLVKGELPRRQQADMLQLPGGELGLRVEAPQGVDLVIQQVDTHGVGAAHGEDVHNGAAHGELPVLIHRLHRLIAGLHHLLPHLFDGEVLPPLKHKAVGGDITARRQTVHQTGDRRHQYPPLQRRQPIQRGDAVGGDVLMRRESIVRQGLPIRQRKHRHRPGLSARGGLSAEPRKFPPKHLSHLIAFRNQQQRPVTTRRGINQRQTHSRPIALRPTDGLPRFNRQRRCENGGHISIVTPQAGQTKHQSRPLSPHWL